MLASAGPCCPGICRLLELAKIRDSGRVDRIARFIAGTYNGEAFLFDRFELRMVNIANSDDMLICLDALRWDKADLHELVPAGQPRAQAAIKKPGLKWPEQTA